MKLASQTLLIGLAAADIYL